MKSNRKKIGRIGAALVLCGALAIHPISLIFNTAEYAFAANRAATIRGSIINVRSGAGTNTSKVTSLTSGTPITVTGETTGSDGKIWYSVTYSGGSGFVRSDFVRFSATYNYDSSFEQQLSDQGFPESYKDGLRQLHALYPNWVFQGFQTGLDWTAALDGEMEGTNSLIDKDSISSWKSTEDGKFDWSSSSWPGFDGATWVGASREITAYYMDPRNFLDDKYVFQFAIHSYDASAQTMDGLKSMLRGTFMDSGAASSAGTVFTDTGSTPTGSTETAANTAATETASETTASSEEVLIGFDAPTGDSGVYYSPAVEGAGIYYAPGSAAVISVGEGPGVGLSSNSATGSGSSGSSSTQVITLDGANTYADIIMEAAVKTQQNPYVLASMILQEQGSGKSGSISGTSGYYNYFNVGAYAANGMTAIERGIWYASQNGSYNRPWTSVEKAIVGGAQFFAENYLKAGQNTLYLKKFNVQGSNLYQHQYMTNVQGAAEEGAKLAGAYSESMRSNALIFSIPIYQNMPESPCPMPTGDGSPNNKLSDLSVPGFTITPNFQRDTTSYTLVVDESVSAVTVSATAIESHASVSGTGTISLGQSSTEVPIVVTAQNGDTRRYTLLINRQSGGQSGNGTASVVASEGSSGGPGTTSVSAETSSGDANSGGAAVIDIGNSPVG